MRMGHGVGGIGGQDRLFQMEETCRCWPGKRVEEGRDLRCEEGTGTPRGRVGGAPSLEPRGQVARQHRGTPMLGWGSAGWWGWG